MATSYPSALDSAAYLNSLLALRHNPAQFNLLLEGLVDAVVALQTKAGTTAGGSNADIINEVTAANGVVVDGLRIKDGGFSMTTGSAQYPRGTAASVILHGYGATAAEGLQVAALDETISFAANAALYKELTYTMPANGVILCAQANIEAALTGGGTTTKVGLGTSSDPDAYGKTSGLTKNLKITTTPDWAVIASPTALRLSSCANDGSAGDTALTVGSVRVRIIFLAPANLADAA